MNDGPWTIGMMRTEDLPQVLAIESSSFSSPWPPGAFAAELENRFARLLVARDPGGAVAGYLCLWILHDELLINNLAVAPSRRGQGIGSLLLDEAIRMAAAAGCRSAWLEVRPSNQAALQLYRGRGFEVAQRRRSYYGDTGEDALVMSAALKVPESG